MFLEATTSAIVTLGIYKTYEKAFSNIIGKEEVYKPNTENHIKYDKFRLR